MALLYFGKIMWKKRKGRRLTPSRFDDTNPSNEKQEFEDAIVEDLALMGSSL